MSVPTPPQSNPVQCKLSHLKVAAATSDVEASAPSQTKKPKAKPKSKKIVEEERKMFKDRASFVWAWVFFPLNSKVQIHNTAYQPKSVTLALQHSNIQNSRFTFQHSIIHNPTFQFITHHSNPLLVARTLPQGEFDHQE